MAKATHAGHCQACGRLQRLPSGNLSLHGYTVDHGWFSGVCQGAKHLPFEQSIDQILNVYLPSAEAELKRLIEAQVAIRAVVPEVFSTGELTAEVKAPVPVQVTNPRGYGYGDRYDVTEVLLHVTVVPRTERCDYFKQDVEYAYAHPFGYVSTGYRAKTVVAGDKIVADGFGDTHSNSAFGRYGDDRGYEVKKDWTAEKAAFETAKAYYEMEARTYDPRIRQMKSYVKWQRDRIAGWKPSDLVPVSTKDDKQGFDLEAAAKEER